MSVVPFLRAFWDDPWEGMTAPSRLFDQAFGDVLSADDFLPPTMWRGMVVTPRVQRPPQLSGMSEVSVKMDAEVCACYLLNLKLFHTSL